MEELRKDFEAGVDSYLEGCKADGVEPAKPYSGRLNLRMSSELHSRVAAFVAASGTTINDFINRAIKNELNHVAVL
mgnify:FL=1